VDIRKKLFTERIHWNKLCREVVIAPILLVFRKLLDNILDIWFKFMLPCVESGAGLDDPRASFPTQDIL